jgi:hypothetical protein
MNWLTSLLALLVLGQPSSPPASTDVPLDVQVPAFLKALGYDRNLQVTEGALVVGVVFDPVDRASMSTKDRLLEIQKALTRLRVKGKNVVFVPVPYERGDNDAEIGAQVLVVAPLPPDAVATLARRGEAEGVLTIATVPKDVERGLAMGMELNGARPRFVVNLSAAMGAGASFESSFLALCRIVER